MSELERAAREGYMEISKKVHLPTRNTGEDQADGTFEDDEEKDKGLDKTDHEIKNPTQKEDDDVNDEEKEEEQDPDSDKDKA